MLIDSALKLSFLLLDTVVIVYSSYKNLRILILLFQRYGSTYVSVCHMQWRFLYHVPVCPSHLCYHVQSIRSGYRKFTRCYKETENIGRRPGNGRPSAEIKQIVDEQKRKGNATSAFQLHALLLSRGYYQSIRAILRCRTTLCWTFHGTAYCQLICELNKLKLLEWAQAYCNEAKDSWTLRGQMNAQYSWRLTGD